MGTEGRLSTVKEICMGAAEGGMARLYEDCGGFSCSVGAQAGGNLGIG